MDFYENVWYTHKKNSNENQAATAQTIKSHNLVVVLTNLNKIENASQTL